MDYLLYLLVPFVISACVTPIVKKIAVQLDAYAQINERTIHSGKIARIGGVGIYIAFIIAMTMFVKVDSTFNAILIGGFIMFIGGLAVSYTHLHPNTKGDV